MPDKISKLLRARKSQYGDTWLEAGQVIGLLSKPFQKMVTECPQYVHNWVLILSKLIRILYTPYNADHYKDIAGYATLCLNDLERKTDEPTSVISE